MKHELVYFIKPVGLDGPVKIGCSMVPEERLMHLSVWSPWPLELLVSIKGDKQLEANIHDCFADSHSHREWFRSTPRLRKLIKDLKAGTAIDEALDLSDRKDNVRSNRRDYGSEAKLRMSYRMRVNWVEWHQERLGNSARYRPADIDEILDRWSGYGKQPKVTPTEAEFARLDEFLADPVKDMVVPSWSREAA